jgi:hypothetical protein
MQPGRSAVIPPRNLAPLQYLIPALTPQEAPMSTQPEIPSLFDPDDDFEAWTLDELNDLPGDAGGSMALGAGGRHGDHDD